MSNCLAKKMNFLYKKLGWGLTELDSINCDMDVLRKRVAQSYAKIHTSFSVLLDFRQKFILEQFKTSSLYVLRESQQTKTIKNCFNNKFSIKNSYKIENFITQCHLMQRFINDWNKYSQPLKCKIGERSTMKFSYKSRNFMFHMILFYWLKKKTFLNNEKEQKSFTNLFDKKIIFFSIDLAWIVWLKINFLVWLEII